IHLATLQKLKHLLRALAHCLLCGGGTLGFRLDHRGHPRTRRGDADGVLTHYRHDALAAASLSRRIGRDESRVSGNGREREEEGEAVKRFHDLPTECTGRRRVPVNWGEHGAFPERKNFAFDPDTRRLRRHDAHSLPAAKGQNLNSENAVDGPTPAANRAS